MKGDPLMCTWALNCKHYTKLEGVARDKHSGLLRKLVNYGRKQFYNIGPYCATVRELYRKGCEIASLSCYEKG
jgi:hypothetical protein